MSALRLQFPEIQADIEARAREWFVRLLDQDVGREELLAWERWLDSDDRHRAAYERAQDAWRHMQAAELDAPTAEELAQDRYLAGMAVARWRKARRGRLKLVLPIAALFVAVLSLGLVAWFGLVRHGLPAQQFATPRAQHLEASLQDGSHIRLGAMTTLKVAFGEGRREVGMVRGEALFNVAHDRTRPFVVHTPLAAITAVGTAFDIDIETHAVTLVVTEGTVGVTPDAHSEGVRTDPGTSSPILIHAGQRLEMAWDGAHLIFALSDSASGASWTQGRLEYRDTSLRSVIADVNRYTTKPIVVADGDLDGLEYSGTVQLQAADTWVLGLPAAFPLSVELNDHGQYVLRQKAPASAPRAL